jgi:molybdopterin-guanine dinucleotide biosynthesis protein A
MKVLPAAAVLAGGTSRRFGSDKTLALFQGRPLIRHVTEGAVPFAQKIIVVAKDTEKYAFLGLDRAADKYGEQCQLAGIITALETVPDGLVFVIAADMPCFPFDALPEMAALAEGFDAAVPRIDSRPCPCAAIYRQAAKKVFTDSFMAGDYRISNSLAKLRVNYIDEHFFSKYGDPRRGFMNINTRADLESLWDSPG